MKRARTPMTSSARASLQMLLTNAPDDKLAGFSVDKLAAINLTTRAEIQAMLYAEQMRRRRQTSQ